MLSAYVLVSAVATDAALFADASGSGPRSTFATPFFGTSLGGFSMPDWSGPLIPIAQGGSMPRASGSAENIRRASRIPPTPSICEWCTFT